MADATTFPASDRGTPVTAANDERRRSTIVPPHADPTTHDTSVIANDAHPADAARNASSYYQRGPQPTAYPTNDENLQRPLHTQTKSNLSPTSEFIRLLLLALPTRYLARGPSKIFFHRPEHAGAQQMFYALAMGLGSTLLSLKYGQMVKHDIRTIFSEAVAMEKGIAPNDVTFSDIKKSDNSIVQTTIKTYYTRLFKRMTTDLLFFLAAPFVLLANNGIWRHGEVKEGVVDTLVGLKGGIALQETWNRKTTIFEDLVTFITNKLNPRNGLGQPISVGEVFDLYQHYAEGHMPANMFHNVLSRDTSPSERLAINQPVFSRITELMNLTYAYKHNNVSEEAVHGADFALPKFIYMLGHDLINPYQPQQTLAYVEIMNARGVEEIRQAQAQFAQGATPEAVLQQFGLALPISRTTPLEPSNNGVIAKGSTVQLETANDNLSAANDHDQGPVAKIDAGSIAHAGVTDLALAERAVSA